PADASPVPIWPLIERSQKEYLPECWLITQPAHAALSGEMATLLSPGAFGKIETELAQAIAMHDYGGSGPDAREGRTMLAANCRKAVTPASFLEVGTDEVIQIWTGSIDAAEKITPAGGWIVAEHFKRIAQMDIRVAKSGFTEKETRRQKKLSSKTKLPEPE